MRIIKEGNNENKLPKFTCKHCGCEFECNSSEYWTDTSVCLTSCPPQYTVYASCPCCYKICSTYKTSKVSSQTITVCGEKIDINDGITGTTKVTL